MEEKHSGSTAIITQERTKVQRPPLYKVLLLNDDYTPMEFVVMVLEKYFNKSHGEATELMLEVHHQGRAICGMFPLEIAETKVTQVLHKSKEHEYPLQCVLEKN